MNLGLTSNMHTNTWMHVHTRATRGNTQVVLKIHARSLRLEAELFSHLPSLSAFLWHTLKAEWQTDIGMDSHPHNTHFY